MFAPWFMVSADFLTSKKLWGLPGLAQRWP
jgi:hypothetical protein